jgi:hypothetical protein
MMVRKVIAILKAAKITEAPVLGRAPHAEPPGVR